MVSRILRSSKCSPVGSKRIIDIIKDFTRNNPKESLMNEPDWSKWIIFIKNFVSPIMKELGRIDCCNAASMIIGALLFEYQELEYLINAWIKDKCSNNTSEYCCKELVSYIESSKK